MGIPGQLARPYHYREVAVAKWGPGLTLTPGNRRRTHSSTMTKVA